MSIFDIKKGDIIYIQNEEIDEEYLEKYIYNGTITNPSISVWNCKFHEDEKLLLFDIENKFILKDFFGYIPDYNFYKISIDNPLPISSIIKNDEKFYFESSINTPIEIKLIKLDLLENEINEIIYLKHDELYFKPIYNSNQELFNEYIPTDNYYPYNVFKYPLAILKPLNDIIINRPNLISIKSALLNNKKDRIMLSPIKLNKNNEIIDGNHRFNYCKTKGYSLIPIIYI